MSESEVEWVGSSLDDLRRFPEDAKHDCGFQIEQVQHGYEPDDWRPMASVGSGCREIRVRTADGIYRVMYVTKFDDHVYILHSFVKKTQQTPKADIDLGKKRYKAAQKIADDRKRGKA